MLADSRISFACIILSKTQNVTGELIDHYQLRCYSPINNGHRCACISTPASAFTEYIDLTGPTVKVVIDLTDVKGRY
jgi:hypothetical protein